MPKVNCAVIGCTNSTYQLKKWTLEIRDAHHRPGICITKQGNCKDCEKPFALYCFPSVFKKWGEKEIVDKGFKERKQGQDSPVAWI